jgi:hypothetical protein
MSKNFIGKTPKAPKGDFDSPFRGMGVSPTSEIKGLETPESHFPSGPWPMPNFKMSRKS